MALPLAQLAQQGQQAGGLIQNASDTYGGDTRLTVPEEINSQTVRGSRLDKRLRNAVLLGLLGAGAGYAVGGGGGAAAGAALGGIGGYAKSRFMDEPELMRQWNEERGLIVENNKVLDQRLKNKSAYYAYQADQYARRGYNDIANRLMFAADPKNFSSITDYEAYQKSVVDPILADATHKLTTDNAMRVRKEGGASAFDSFNAMGGGRAIHIANQVLSGASPPQSNPPGNKKPLPDVKTPAGTAKLMTPTPAPQPMQQPQQQVMTQPEQRLVTSGGQPGVNYSVVWPQLPTDSATATIGEDGKPILGATAAQNTVPLTPDDMLLWEGRVTPTIEQMQAARTAGRNEVNETLDNYATSVQLLQQAAASRVQVDTIGAQIEAIEQNPSIVRGNLGVAESNAGNAWENTRLAGQRQAFEEDKVRQQINAHKSFVGTMMQKIGSDGSPIGVPTRVTSARQALDLIDKGYVQVGGGAGAAKTPTSTTPNTGGLGRPNISGFDFGTPR